VDTHRTILDGRSDNPGNPGLAILDTHSLSQTKTMDKWMSSKLVRVGVHFFYFLNQVRAKGSQCGLYR